MSIDRVDFEAITEADLQELVTAGVPEGLRIEYKRETYGNSDSDRREFAKDVSAFANGEGGHLLIGIEEHQLVAVAIPGLTGIDIDAEILRLEQIARGGIEPRIYGLSIRAIRLAAGNEVLVLRVPKSWNPPHRVIAQGSNRFFVRNSNGVHEPNVEELRTLFTQTASAMELARRFRDQRLSDIQQQLGDPVLEGNGRLLLHVIPTNSFFGTRIGIEAAERANHTFHPLGQGGMPPRYNYHGVLFQRPSNPVCHGYTQIFRDGKLEATKARIVVQDGTLNSAIVRGTGLEQSLLQAFDQYIGGLRQIGVAPPLIVMLTLEAVRGARYIVTNNFLDDGLPQQFGYDVLRLPEGVIEDYGTVVDHREALRPALDALWNSIGYPYARTFGDRPR
jgi:hypothetical protein